MEESKFKPFQKVLVRDDDTQIWGVGFFSHIKDDTSTEYKYVCSPAEPFKQCIPYEGNEYLYGTTLSPTKSRWRAEVGESYYTVMMIKGTPTTTERLETKDFRDNDYFKSRNYFRTKEEADALRDVLIKSFNEFCDESKCKC